MMRKILEYLFTEKTLTKNEAKKLMTKISKEKINEYQIIALLSIYNMRCPTVEEIIGFHQAIMDLSIKIDFKEFNAINIVGTGGNEKNTFNISTLVCFVIAGLGIKVIKHGNYNFTSVTGSSNILEKLGYKFTIEENKLKNQLEKAGICYLHAPYFHPVLKKMVIPRRKLGFRTIFNTIGPLLMVGVTKNLLLGVNRIELARTYNYIFQNYFLKKNNYSIIHSLDGYDEITLTSNVKCYTSKGEKFYLLKELNKRNINVSISELEGGKNIEENVSLFLNILSGGGTAFQKEIILINSAFALNLLNSNGIEKNYKKAKYSLESGNAKNVLKKLLNL